MKVNEPVRASGGIAFRVDGVDKSERDLIPDNLGDYLDGVRDTMFALSATNGVPWRIVIEIGR